METVAANNIFLRKTNDRVNRLNKDIAFSFAFFNTLLICKNLLLSGSAFFYNNNNLINIFLAVFGVALFLRIFIRNGLLTFHSDQLIILLFIMVVWGISLALHNEYFSSSQVKNEIKEFLVYSLPALLFIPLLTRHDYLLQYFYRFRWIMFFAACISVALMATNHHVQGASSIYSEYNMSFGKALILPAILFFSKWFDKKKLFDLLISIICIAFIFLYASRFPLLCILFYVFWKAMISFKPAGRVVFLALLLFAVTLFFVFNDSIADLAATVVSRLGIDSRSIRLIISGNFETDSGRNLIWAAVLNRLDSVPVFGFGAGGTDYILDDGAAHSFIIDTLGSFGYFGGLFFLSASFSIILFCFYKTKAFEKKEFMRIAMSSFFPICMIQTSLWRASFFWILLSLCCGYTSCFLKKGNSVSIGSMENWI